MHDNVRTWVLQLHLGATDSTGSTLVPGNAETWVEFHVERGLAPLRDMLNALPMGTGILLVGEVGLTSHIADVVRKAGAPARLCHSATE